MKKEAVRLSDGIIDQEGRVEICHDGVWGSSCDEEWDKTGAHIDHHPTVGMCKD